jgi:hypothetical protein
MSEIKSVTLSLRAGDSIIEQLSKQAGIEQIFAIIDVRLIKIMQFDANVEVQYQE